MPIRVQSPDFPYQFFGTFGPVAVCCVITVVFFIWVFYGSCGTKQVPFWAELKLVQKTIYRKSSAQNGPRSTIMLGALSGHNPDHARWVVYLCKGQVQGPAFHGCQNTILEFDLKLWPTILTSNVNLAKFKVNLPTKYKDRRSNSSAMRAVTDERMDGRYQVHHLPASRSIKMWNFKIGLFKYQLHGKQLREIAVGSGK